MVFQATNSCDSQYHLFPMKYAWPPINQNTGHTTVPKGTEGTFIPYITHSAPWQKSYLSDYWNWIFTPVKYFPFLAGVDFFNSTTTDKVQSSADKRHLYFIMLKDWTLPWIHKIFLKYFITTASPILPTLACVLNGDVTLLPQAQINRALLKPEFFQFKGVHLLTEDHHIDNLVIRVW